jgi:Spy/CpxP family protein refolding chaperone
MSESIKDERRTKHGFWFGVFLGAGMAAILGMAIVASAKASAAPFASIAPLHGHGFRHGGLDPERAKERAGLAVEFILGQVDANDAQQSQAKRIVTQAIDDLLPLRETHRSNRETLRSELTRPDFDPDAVERFRQSEMALADAASKELAEALIELAQTLTPEQRAELGELAERFHR